MSVERPSHLKTRTIGLAFVMGLGFFYLGGNLFFLQVVKGLEYKKQARAVSQRELPIPAQRGEIFDRHHDLPLVVNQDSFAVDLIPGELSASQLPEVFRRLSTLLSLSPEEIARRVPEKYYHLYQPVEMKGGVDFETIAYLAEHLDEYPGVSWHNKPIRSYLEGDTMAHVIGYVGDITREELQVLYNQGYGFGTVLGKNGLEKQYDRVLRGKDGTRFRVVDVQERKLERNAEEDIPPVPGNDLVLTIDRNIQRLTVEALGQRVGSAIVLKPATGEVLALASWPSYDANLFYTDQSGEEFRRLTLDPSSPFLNRAIQAAYPPASTFKVVLSAALVEEEAFPVNRVVQCKGSLPYGDRVFNDHVKTGHGPVNLFTGLAESCDVYFYTVGDILGVERISRFARDFGYGALSGVDLPGEVAGFVPTPEWKERTQHMKWLGGDTLNMSIGQGYTLATPMQVANMVAMVANAGRIYRPFLVKEVRDPVNGTVITRSRPELIHTSPVRRETFHTVQEAMRRVVTEGTADVVITTKAVEVAGKTGTAEVGLKDRWHSWFAAYGPYQALDPDDQVVVLVMVEARNDWEWWAPKAADVIFQGIFAHQSFQEAVETLKPWWYIQQLQAERARLRAAGGAAGGAAGRGEAAGPAARPGTAAAPVAPAPGLDETGRVQEPGPAAGPVFPYLDLSPPLPAQSAPPAVEAVRPAPPPTVPPPPVQPTAAPQPQPAAPPSAAEPPGTSPSPEPAPAGAGTPPEPAAAPGPAPGDGPQEAAP